VQVTLCQEDRRDEACVHTIDAPGTHHTYDKDSATATLANYIDAHADNIYDEELIATATLATYDKELIAANLATNNKETAADALAIYYEESATLASYDEEFATTTLAAYDEETAAVEGEPWGA
jgi:hypothetical protein